MEGMGNVETEYYCSSFIDQFKILYCIVAVIIHESSYLAYSHMQSTFSKKQKCQKNNILDDQYTEKIQNRRTFRNRVQTHRILNNFIMAKCALYLCCNQAPIVIINNTIVSSMDIWNYKTQGFNYDKYRPAYPPELCRYAIQPLSNKKRYLDIAVGTGKILLSFCDNFEEVKGIDISDQMLQVAQANVQKYMETHPFHSSISLQKSHVFNLKEQEKFDLITVGQALHFFPGKQVLTKLRNMLNEGGMFMTFGYVLREVKSENPSQNSTFYEFYDKMLPYFTFDMYELHRHYTDKLKYPFEEVFDKVDRKQADLVLEITKEEYINYLRTWSAYNIYQEKHGVNPIIELEEKSAEKLTCVFDYFRVRCFK